MPYDKNLDAELFKEVKDFGESRITVGVFSYNNGVKKMQVGRENQNANGEWTFSKLGRLTKDEAIEIIPIMQKAVGNM